MKGYFSCGAHSKSAGRPCRRLVAVEGKRCYFHGGKTTGPKTKKGKERSSKNLIIHGGLTPGLMYCSYCPSRKREPACPEFLEDSVCRPEKRFYDNMMARGVELKLSVEDSLVYRDAVEIFIRGVRGRRNTVFVGDRFDSSRMSESVMKLFRECCLTKASKVESEGGLDLLMYIRERKEKMEDG